VVVAWRIDPNADLSLVHNHEKPGGRTARSPFFDHRHAWIDVKNMASPICARDIGPRDANAAWPKISVIIACLNHDAFSPDALASIINQDCPRRQPIAWMEDRQPQALLPNNFLESRLLAEHGGHRR
jgi:hypothetical protein